MVRCRVGRSLGSKRARWGGFGLSLLLTGVLTAGMGSTGVAAQAVMSRADFNSLIEAERAFAATAVRESVSVAFLSVLAENGLVFSPEPVNGRAQQRVTPIPADFALIWDPRVAAVSRSGDLGFTSGPFTAGARGEAPGGFGTFTTVWRRDSDGAWELLADLGWSHPHDEDLTARPPVLPIAGAGGAAPTWNHEVAETAFATRMTRLHGALDDGSPASELGDMVLPNVRVAGSPGAAGEGVPELVARHGRRSARSWRVVAWGLSSALDMAFAVNRYAPAPGTTGPSGSTLEVWSADDAGWHLLMMMAEDDPAPGGG